MFFRRLYVFAFVHLASRRVLAAACTREPGGAWVTQQARNLSWTLDEQGLKPTVLIHDRDRKFPASFDAVFVACPWCYIGKRRFETPAPG